MPRPQIELISQEDIKPLMDEIAPFIEEHRKWVPAWRPFPLTPSPTACARPSAPRGVALLPPQRQPASGQRSPCCPSTLAAQAVPPTADPLTLAPQPWFPNPTGAH